MSSLLKGAISLIISFSAWSIAPIVYENVYSVMETNIRCDLLCISINDIMLIKYFYASFNLSMEQHL